MILQAATGADLTALLGLEADGFAPRRRWPKSSWSAELEAAKTAPASRLVLVARDSRVVAAASFSTLAPDAELLRIVVAAKARRQGLGARLIEHGAGWACANGAQRMLLEVEHTNDAAIALYRRAGFAEIARRRSYYGPGADALIMAADLHRIDLRPLDRCPADLGASAIGPAEPIRQEQQ